MVGNTHTCFYADLKPWIPWMRLSLWNGNLLPGASVEMMWWETRIISQLFGKRLPFQRWQSASKPLSEHTFGWSISGFNTRSPEMIVNHPKITKGSDWWMMFINVGTVPPYHPKLDSVCIETHALHPHGWQENPGNSGFLYWIYSWTFPILWNWKSSRIGLSIWLVVWNMFYFPIYWE